MDNDKNIRVLLNTIQNELHDTRVIAIDGFAASGKSTLAQALSQSLGAPFFRVDDYYVPFEGRTGEIAGNIDKERFIKEVLQNLNGTKPFYTEYFNCKTQKLMPPQMHEPNKIYIVEGTYSCLPEFLPFYNLTVFLTVEDMTQLKRLQQREPLSNLENFKNIWIPRERRYFDEYNVSQNCDMILSTDSDC